MNEDEVQDTTSERQKSDKAKSFSFFDLRELFRRIGIFVSKGALQSYDYETLSSGWKISANGDVEFNNGIFRGSLEVGGLWISIGPTDDIQAAINTVSENGGGKVTLTAGTYMLTAHLTLPSNCTLEGNGAAIIDFGSAAHQIQIVGDTAYKTGTVSISSGGTAVTGAGTTFTSGMVGQSILLQEIFYTVSAFIDATHITISSAYLGTDLSASYYVICNAIGNINLNNVTVQNSTLAGIKLQYTNFTTFNGVTVQYCANGIDGDDSIGNTMLNSGIVSCTVGMTLDYFHFGAVFNFNLLLCGPAFITNCRNIGWEDFSISNSTGNGFTLTNMFNWAFVDFTIQHCAGHGIEMAGGCNQNQITAGGIIYNTGDGIKLTATNRSNVVSNCSLFNNTGYGINVAAASNNKNAFTSNSLDGNSQGEGQNLGVGTVFQGNTGLKDFSSIELLNSSGGSRAAGECVIFRIPGYPASANIQAHYALDEASGNRADTSGNGNTLTSVNGVTRDTVNKQEGAASGAFASASSQYLKITNAAQTGLNITGSLTLSGWVKFSSLSGSPTIVGKWDAPGNKRQYILYIASNKLHMSISVDGTNQVSVTGTTTIATGTWYYVTGVYIPGISMSLYIGTASTASVLDAQLTTSVPASIFSSTGDFTIGADSDSSATDFLDGLIDDVLVLNTALTGDQIEAARLFPSTPSAIGDEFTTTTTAGDPHILGVLQEAVGSGLRANLTEEGTIINLKVDGTTDIAIGDFLGTHTVAGIAAKAAVGSGKTAFAYALAGYTTNDSNGVIRALIIAPRTV